MVLRRSIKALLVLVAMAVVVAIVFSFLTRSRTLPPPPANDLLPPDVESRGTDFDHREFKFGKIVFRVRSETDTVSAQGERQLREVELLVFGDDGEVQDAVTGQEATYWVDEKRIELRKDVEIRLSDGTRIYSKSLLGDLEKETIEIRDGFTFERPDARGSGIELEYRISDRQLSVHRSFRMKTIGTANILDVSSEVVEYDFSKGLMDLFREAVIRSQDETLQASRILVSLTPESRVQRVDARGNARFASPPHAFKGASILIDFAESGAGISSFRVNSAEEGESGSRATYRQNSPTGDHQVVADRLELTPLSGAASSSDVQLKSFRASGDVRLDSSSHFLQNSRSDRLLGLFGETGDLQRINLAGNVHLERTPPGAAQQFLEAPSVLCLFENGRLTMADVKGPLELRLQGETQTRTLQAQDSFRVTFEKGQPLEMAARGDVKIDTSGPGPASSLRAPELDVSFTAGFLRELQARPTVELTSLANGSTRTSRSQHLKADFEAGGLTLVRQSGDFVLVESDGLNKTELEADEGLFLAASQVVETAGTQLGTLRQWDDLAGPPVVTRARRFILSSTSRAVTAEGSVQSEFVDARENQTFRISAGRMQASEEAEWVVYDRGQPQFTMENSRATGRQIRLQKSSGLLRVEGDVDSRLQRISETGTQEYRIRSEALELDRAQGHALYTGSVQARSEEMLLKAPFVELFLASGAGGKVEKVRAWDGVEIVEPSRTAIGDTCLYLPEQNVVRLTGSPAQVTDAKQGRAFGPLLVFYPGTDTLVIESSPEKKP